jgi:hypothetical protein
LLSSGVSFIQIGLVQFKGNLRNFVPNPRRTLPPLPPPPRNLHLKSCYRPRKYYSKYTGTLQAPQWRAEDAKAILLGYWKIAKAAGLWPVAALSLCTSKREGSGKAVVDLQLLAFFLLEGWGHGCL